MTPTLAARVSPVTVTAQQIELADARLHNADAIASACNKTGARFYMACAMIQKESGGRNVYGHDSGGALSGFPKNVNQGNYQVFEWLIFTKGQTSNGVGPAQITFKGFFTQMREEGLKPWEPADNILFGVRLLNGYYRTARDELQMEVWDAVRYAGKKYNGSIVYGDSLVVIAKEWRELVGNADYA